MELSRCEKRDWLAHLLAWTGGAMIALTPFFREWTVTVGSFSCAARVWPGNFIIMLMVGGAMASAGAAMGGGWWVAGGGRGSRGGQWIAASLFAWGLAGWLGALPQPLYWYMAAALALYFAISMVGAAKARKQTGTVLALNPVMPWNGVLCVAIIAISLMSDRRALAGHDVTGTATLAFLLARGLTQVAVVVIGWWGLHLLMLWSPRGMKWVTGLMAGTALLGVLANYGMGLLWGKGLTLFFGEFAVQDKFDLVRVMEGGNVKLGLAGVLGVAAVVLAIAGLYLLTRWISAKLRLRVRPCTLLMVAFGSWFLFLGEQATERFWNDRAGHWLQRRSLLMHLWFSPMSPGVASFKVEFNDFPTPTGAGATRKPDVFLFICETLRADAMRPEITPFLCRWRDTDCQEIARCHSASNATHLSWYGMLSGRPPVWWDHGRQLKQPAPLLRCLKANGYRNEIRSASVFDYVEMDTTNFGHGEATDQMQNLRIDPSSWPPGPSACDGRVLDLWKAGVSAQPPGAGPVFRLTDLESPHYPHHWPPDFAVPHKDYFKSKVFPFRPTPENVRLIRNRYENSVAYVDHLFEQYISFLKERGIYDDAMIIITGDHGEEFQEHGFWFHATALSHEQTLVPLYVKWPKSMGRGPAVADASHLDIVPSVLSALGCPESQWSGMAGRSLYHAGEESILITSNYASQNGEGMQWRRGPWEAAFSWRKIWVPGAPEHLWLERLTGPDGPVWPDSPEAAEKMLHEIFPDAFARWFDRFELLPPGAAED